MQNQLGFGGGPTFEIFKKKRENRKLFENRKKFVKVLT